MNTKYIFLNADPWQEGVGKYYIGLNNKKIWSVSVSGRKFVCYLKNDNTFIIWVVYLRILSCELLLHCVIYCKILPFRLLIDCVMHCTNCQETTFKHSPTVPWSTNEMIFFSGEKKYGKILGVFWKLIYSNIEKFNELHDTQQIFDTGRKSIRD